ncbi:MAG TPA: DUF4174 domain-containing protein [Fimbriimonas sp.]
MEKPRQLSVESFRNRNRVLVLFATTASDPDRQEQWELLAGQMEGILDRDIVVLEVFEKGSATLDNQPIKLLGTSTLRERFECRKGEFRAVLIAKDGRSAQSFDHPVEPQRLFELIDSTPQRREEIRNRLGGEPYAG